MGIFSDVLNDCLEIFMDYFTPYEDAFETALANLEKVMEHCEQTNVSLNMEKFHMMMTKGIVLGNFISADGIKVDPTKIEVISKIATPNTLKEVRSFLGHAGYYRRFIENFSKISSPLFSLLMKEVEFVWTKKCEHAFLKLKNCVIATPIL